jgi:hypothetical protein
VNVIYGLVSFAGRLEYATEFSDFKQLDKIQKQKIAKHNILSQKCSEMFIKIVSQYAESFLANLHFYILKIHST